MTITSTAPAVRDARSYLAPTEFNCVSGTVQKDNADMAPAIADRITLEALKFVAVAAKGAKGIAPSRIVDEGWHALILHTDLYARLCDRLGGGFVHHYPELPDASRYDPEFINRTMAAIQAAGFNVDRELWVAPDVTLIEVSAKCQHAPNCTIKPGPKPECLPGTAA